MTAPATTYFLAPDGGDEPTLWRGQPDDDRPVPMLRRCDIQPEGRDEIWALLAAVTATGPRADDCVSDTHWHVGRCQRAGYANGLLDAAEVGR